MIFELLLVLILSWDIENYRPSDLIGKMEIFRFHRLNYVANPMARERLKEILCNLHFYNNEEALPR